MLRQAEVHLNAQLTSAIAADQRAYTFAGLSVASVVLLLGGSYRAISSDPPDLRVAALAFLVGMGLFVASWMAVLSARSIGFDFAGSRPGVWVDDIVEGKGLARSLAEQCEHYDSAITSNRERVERNGRLFNQSVNVALFAVGSGGLIFLWWLRAPLGL